MERRWCIGGAHCLACLPARGIAEDGALHAVETGVALKWEMRPDAHKRVLLGIHYDTVYSPAHVQLNANWSARTN